MRGHGKTAVELVAIGRFLVRGTRRAAVTLLGALLLVVGVVGLALPILPGWLLIFTGLAVLAGEYTWARNALEAARRKATSTGRTLRAVAARGRRAEPAGEVVVDLTGPEFGAEAASPRGA